MFFAYVYITRVYKLPLFSFCYFSLSFFLYFSFLFHERIFPGGLQLFVFPHLPPFPVHILLGCFSLSIPFFIVLDATFALIYTAPSDFLFFFLSPLHAVEFSFSSYFFFLSFLLHFSFSFDAYIALCPFDVVRDAVAFFIVFVPLCRPCSRAAAGAPMLFQVFHARKRALSYFPQFPFSRSSHQCARVLVRSVGRYDIFRFSFRYVRSVSDT